MGHQRGVTDPFGGAPAPVAGLSRRRFLGYLIAAPTCVAAARLGGDLLLPPEAAATMLPGAVPSPPEMSDEFDLGDLQDMAAAPTANLITVTINRDGSASFALPRLESGQGVTTSTAMIIAEELDLPVEQVHVTLADGRPELMFNQFTAGSNTTRSTFTPIRVAAAAARGRLLQAASVVLGDEVTALTANGGVITASNGASVTYASLATKAATATTTAVPVTLKPTSQFTVIGKPTNRVDALAAVTGTKTYTMDLVVPGVDAKPTMICRPPTIKGTPTSVPNLAAVKAMPGITDVVQISTGVAVRGNTFGQCIDAVRALKVTWGPGSVDTKSDATVLNDVKAAELPVASVPDLLTKSIDRTFTFWWKSNSALEPQTCVADVRPDRCDIWSAMQTPIYAQEQVALTLGLPVSAVTAHVTEGGGAFGRRMFLNVITEAVEISKALGKPVKLMWDRTAEFRVGRVHPLCTSRVRATYQGANVLSLEQRHTGVQTDYTEGFGEIIDAYGAQVPGVNFAAFDQGVFELTANVPYNFGATDQALMEIYNYDTFATGSVRNLYSPDLATAQELVVDQLAGATGSDPYTFRSTYLKDDRSRAVLDAVAKAGAWGRSMPSGTAQGIAFHKEYKGVSACLVEIDCTSATVNRPIRDGVTGPRVTKAVFAVDVGLPINPTGLAAQMEGGIMEGIGQVLTESLHLDQGNYLEGSWDNYFFTRQWNSPLDVQVIVMPPTTGQPGGAGEFGVAAAKAAVACAYARATKTLPTSFPINHEGPLEFDPYPREPSLPASPTDGLDYTY